MKDRVEDEFLFLEPAISGSGGKKKKKAKKPREQKDNLQSTATAKIMDLLCEGEIVGLVDGAKGIFLDQTPVQNSDGSYNFEGFTWEERTGTQDQSYVATAAEGISSDFTVNVTVKKSTGAVVRTLSDANTDAIKVRIGIPALRNFRSNGNIDGSKVDLTIEIKEGNGSYVMRVNDRIEGKTSSLYEKEYLMPVTSGQSSYQIRVTRLTDDSTSTNKQNEFKWVSYSKVINSKLRYPNSALVGMAFDAQDFSNIPERSYLIRGTIVRVPNNTSTNDDGSLSYSGTWDGTFRLSWTSNPAWCLYDLLENERYGVGIAQQYLDKWSFYAIGQYCDEQVSNGKGGTEPRFSLNCYLQSKEKAYEIINALCSVFRGLAYYDSGTIAIVQDRPRDPTRLFNDANVSEEGFEYQGSDLKVRHNTALVTWNDPNDRYLRRIEVVEDREDITKNGVRQTELTAFGCTSQGQAHRLGKWTLISELVETETVTFTTATEGIPVRPGEVIKVADRHRSGFTSWGRIVAISGCNGIQQQYGGYSSSDLTAILDRNIEFSGSTQYYINLMSSSGKSDRVPLLSVSGTTNSVDFQNIWNDDDDHPIPGSVYIIESDDIEAQLFRVVSVSESASSGGLEYKIVALKYNASKFAAVEQGLILEEPTTSISPPDPPLKPQNVRGYAYFTADGTFNIGLLWQYPTLNGSRDPYTSYFLVQYRQGEYGSWSAASNVSGTSFDSGNLPQGTYYARVAAVNLYDDVSDWVETGEILFAIIPQAFDTTTSVGTPTVLENITILRVSSGISAAINCGTPSLVAGTIVPQAIETHLITDSTSELGTYFVFGSNFGEMPTGELFVSSDNSNYVSTGAITAASTIGQVSGILGSANPDLIDRHNKITVTLLHGTLASTTESGFYDGENAALIGSEIVYFRNAVLTGTNTYELSELSRGRRGTEWAIANHVTNERFVLLRGNGSYFKRQTFSQSAIDTTVYYKAVTQSGSLAQAQAYSFTFTAVDQKPYAPAHLRCSLEDNGDRVITWVRRSRKDGEWADSSDVPLNETTESYLVEIMSEATIVRSVTVSSPIYTYTTAQQTTDFGSLPDSLTVQVAQISSVVGAGYKNKATFTE